MTELNDRALLTHWYRHRNAEAFHVLATRHARMVYATALRVLRDAQDAEDVSQESFLALAQAKRPPSRNVAAWLHRTAYHAALKVIRARARRRARDVEYVRTQADAVLAEWNDIRELLDEAVAGLPDAYREPLVRHFFEQESHSAIAAALGIPRQTVTHSIGKGIEGVRQRLKLKGVVAPAGAALAALVHENSAQALPANLAAELGRISLAATPSVWAVVATYTGGAGLKVAAAVLVVGGAVVAGVATTGTNHGPVRQNLVAMADTVAARSVIAPPNQTTVGGVEAEAAIESPVRAALGETAPAPADSVAETNTTASVAGVALFPDGRPYSGTHILLLNSAEVDTQPAQIDWFAMAGTDDGGRFKFPKLAPGEYSVFLTSVPRVDPESLQAESARFTLAAGEHKSDFRVVDKGKGELSISGTVVDGSGNPLAKVQIHAVSPTSGSLDTATSDKQGRFTLRGLPEGRYTLAVDPLSSTRFNQTAVAADAGDQDVRFVLQYTGAVGGRVIDGRSRQPVTRFEVGHLRGLHAELIGRRPNFRKDFDDPDGRFSYEGFQSGEGTVVVRAPGYAPALVPVSVPERGAISDLAIELTPGPGGEIAGRVLAEDGQPIAGARIYLERPEIQPIRQHQKVVAETDASGEFRVADALPGQREIYAWHPGYVPAGGETSADSMIVLKRACRLTVEVVSGGAPLDKVRIGTGSWGASGTTDPAGRAELEEVPQGEVEVTASCENGRARREPVHVEPDRENVLRIELAPAQASVEGTVYDDGGPVGTGTVNLFVETATGLETLSRPVLPEGSFHFPEVPLGAAQLAVTAGKPQRRVFADDVKLAEGMVTTLDVDVSIAAWVRGSVNGLENGKKASVRILRGAIGEEDALETAVGPERDMTSAGMAIVKSGAFEAPLVRPGTYTVLLLVHPGIILNEYEHYDLRVVEIPDGGDLEVDFDLRQ